MTPFSYSFLDDQLSALRKKLADLLTLCAANGYGIVSNNIECETPTNLTVAYNEKTSRLELISGTYVTRGGQIGNVDKDITDIVWPEDEKLYVVLRSETQTKAASDSYGMLTWSIAEPVMYLSLFTQSDLDAYDSTQLIIAAILTHTGIGDSTESDIDQTQLYNASNRPTWSVVDSYHRSRVYQNAKPTNPHGLGLDQIYAGTRSILAQTVKFGCVSTDSGTKPGIPGEVHTETFSSTIIIDAIGRIVPPGHYYVLLPSIPVNMPEADVDFVWEEGTVVLDFGTAAISTATVTWFVASGCQVSGLLSSTLEITAQDNATIISDGAVPQLKKATTFSTGAYKNLPIRLDIQIDKSGTVKAVPGIIDTVTPASSTAPTADMPITLPYASQIGLRIRNSPLALPSPPPSGVLATSSTACYGTYVFTYTITVPAASEALVLAVGPGAYTAATSVTYPDTLTIAGSVIGKAYWNCRDGILYLEPKAYRAGACVLSRAAYETKRYRGGSHTVIGTSEEPAGVKAVATVVIRAALSATDTISVKFDTVNNAVTKSIVTATGDTPATIAVKVANIFNADALFTDYCIASASGSTVAFTAKIAGTSGNSYALSASIVDASTKVKLTDFTGGAAYTASASDIVGAAVTVHHAQTGLPEGSVINLYATGNTDNGDTGTTFKKLAEIPITDTTYSYTHSVTTADLTAYSDTYDTTKQFSATVQVSGLDPSGATTTESISLTEYEVCEATTADSEMATVFSKNVYSVLTAYVVSASANTINTEIVLLANALAKNSSQARLAEVTTDGSVVTSIVDKRTLQPEHFTQTHEYQADGVVGAILLRGISD